MLISLLITEKYLVTFSLGGGTSLFVFLFYN